MTNCCDSLSILQPKGVHTPSGKRFYVLKHKKITLSL